MIYRTYGDLRAELEREIDIEAEDFIQPDEVLGYFNDAIREAASHIYKLGLEDDYFKSEKTYSLTNGLQYLTMPDNIYAGKISGLIYATPEKVYPIKRVKGPNKEVIIQNILQNPTAGSYYSYDILNNSPTEGFRINLYPFSYEDRANCIVLRYVRNVEKIVNDSSLVDVPEFYSFVKAFVKYKVLNKEGTAMGADAKADYEKEKGLMLETLAELTPDYDSRITPDLSIYEEMS